MALTRNKLNLSNSEEQHKSEPEKKVACISAL